MSGSSQKSGGKKTEAKATDWQSLSSAASSQKTTQSYSYTTTTSGEMTGAVPLMSNGLGYPS